MQNWYHILEQVDTTIKLLRPSRINPNISEYAQMNGTFDYNRTPTPPPDTRTIVH